MVMTWGWFMIVLTNNVLLVKIEGPVWYTIYHHRNLLWKEFLQPPLWKSTNQWEFATPMVLNHMTSWHFAHVADQLPPRSPVGCLETLRVAWPAPGRHGKLVGGITGITTPLKKNKSVGWDDIPNTWKNKNVPSHPPEIIGDQLS